MSENEEPLSLTSASSSHRVSANRIGVEGEPCYESCSSGSFNDAHMVDISTRNIVNESVRESSEGSVEGGREGGESDSCNMHYHLRRRDAVFLPSGLPQSVLAEVRAH